MSTRRRDDHVLPRCLNVGCAVPRRAVLGDAGEGQRGTVLGMMGGEPGGRLTREVRALAGETAYDVHADWYDAYISGPAASHTRRTTAALSAFAGRGRGVCLDVGCGTGVHAASLRSLGWDVVGVDLSFGQLRHARERLPVAVADASHLPVAAQSVDLAVATLIHTDVPDWDATVSEVARALRPGGRFVYVGVHPCFVGPFAERADEQVHLHTGYDRGGLTFEGPGMGGGIRRKVGVRHRTLAELVNAVTRSGLTLTRLEEPSAGPAPDLLVLEASA